MAFNFDMIQSHYSVLPQRVSNARKRLGPPNINRKILYSHLWGKMDIYGRGADYADFRPDRVAMQDATAKWHYYNYDGWKKRLFNGACRPFNSGKTGSNQDLSFALDVSLKVYDFLSSVNKYGIGFWKPGAGIIHQVVTENYAFPGGMMIGTDSHTVNGWIGYTVAIGVGGADAVDVMAGIPWELKFPKLIGVKLTGELSGWASKDVILKGCRILTVKGGTGCIVEYFGEGAKSLSYFGKGAIATWVRRLVQPHQLSI